MNPNYPTYGKQLKSRASLRNKSAEQAQTPSARKSIVKRKLGDLRPYPRQAEMFSDLPEHELRMLMDGMKTDQFYDPVEITSDGTIISGHQRVRAAKRLGWKAIRCWVRDDLESHGPDAIERRFIVANFNRRQMGPMDKARCYRRLKQLEKNGHGNNGKVKGDLRDYLAKQLGFSGRNLDRWERLLDAPLDIQRAVTEKKLKLVVGVDVAGLPKDTQEHIARAIRRGTEPEQAVAAHLKKKAAMPTPDTAYRRLRRVLEQLVPVLAPNIRDVHLRFCRRDLPLLRRSEKLHRALVTRIEKQADKESPETEKRLAALLALGESTSRKEN